jgi:hypothetical protein
MLKSYFRIFFWMTLFFFIGTLVANLNMMEGMSSIIEGFVGALLFGVAASAAVGTLNARRARQVAGANAQGDIYSPVQTRKIKLSLPSDRVFHMVSHYFREVARFDVLGGDQLAGSLEARVPASMLRVMGSGIKAEVAKDGEGSVVTITARPALPAAMADFGKNLKLVLDAENYLKAADHQ